MTPGGILETAIYARDLVAAQDFYGRILGLEQVVHVPGRHVFYRVGAGILLVFNPDQTIIPTTNARLPVPPHGAVGPGHVCFAASADELVRWREHLRGHGVAIEADFAWPNGAQSIYLRDPAGNSVEFAEPALWGLAAL